MPTEADLIEAVERPYSCRLLSGVPALECYRTAGIRRALKALGRRKKQNLRRVAGGKKPIVAGKKVSAKSIGLTKSKAKQRLKNNK